jgi:hypothetical protein
VIKDRNVRKIVGKREKVEKVIITRVEKEIEEVRQIEDVTQIGEVRKIMQVRKIGEETKDCGGEIEKMREGV